MPSPFRILLLAALAAGAAWAPVRTSSAGPSAEAAPAAAADRIDLVEAAVQSARARGALQGMTDAEAREIARQTMALQEVRTIRNPIVDKLLAMDESSLASLSPAAPARRLRGFLIAALPKLEWFLWSVPGVLLLAGSALLLAGRRESVSAFALVGEIYCWTWLTLLCAAVALTGWAPGTRPWADIPRFFWGVPFLLWISSIVLSLSAARPAPRPSRRNDPYTQPVLAADLSPSVSRRVRGAVDRLLERWLG